MSQNRKHETQREVVTIYANSFANHAHWNRIPGRKHFHEAIRRWNSKSNNAAFAKISSFPSPGSLHPQPLPFSNSPCVHLTSFTPLKYLYGAPRALEQDRDKQRGIKYTIKLAGPGQRKGVVGVGKEAKLLYRPRGSSRRFHPHHGSLLPGRINKSNWLE